MNRARTRSVQESKGKIGFDEWGETYAQRRIQACLDARQVVSAIQSGSLSKRNTQQPKSKIDPSRSSRRRNVLAMKYSRRWPSARTSTMPACLSTRRCFDVLY